MGKGWKIGFWKRIDNRLNSKIWISVTCDLLHYDQSVDQN